MDAGENEQTFGGTQAPNVEVHLPVVLRDRESIYSLLQSNWNYGCMVRDD